MYVVYVDVCRPVLCKFVSSAMFAGRVWCMSCMSTECQSRKIVETNRRHFGFSQILDHEIFDLPTYTTYMPDKHGHFSKRRKSTKNRETKFLIQEFSILSSRISKKFQKGFGFQNFKFQIPKNYNCQVARDSS
jgi:hypothetical protein